MFFTPIVASSVCTPTGKTLSVLDPEGVQQALQSLSNESSLVDGKIQALEKRMMELEAFTRFCAQQYPEVINEFTLATLVKTRLGVEKKA